MVRVRAGSAALMVTWLLAACGGASTSGSAGGGTPTGPGTNPPPAAPTVSLSAAPASVAAGGSSVLTWSSSGATGCSAAGAWAGAKATSGSQTIGPIASTSTFTLTCSGAGGSTTRSATVTVVSGGANVSGTVDSSRINAAGANAVYVYAGSVVPDDVGGSGANPLTVVPVVQDNGACTWRYAVSGLGAGQYTLAFTNQAANDSAAQDDAIAFTGTTTITVGSGAVVQDFPAARTLRVGPGRPYATARAAAAAAQDGDVIEFDASVTYDDDIVVWRRNNLMLRGVGGRAHMRATRRIPYTPGNDQENGMGIWVTRGNGIKVENIEFSGAAVDDRNGAGIRAEGRDLTVCNSYFHDNENGILGGNGNVLVEYSEFANNGGCEPGYGCSHNMYILSGTSRFTLRHSYSHHARIGHTVKSRAQENYILYNRIMDEASGTASYIIDLPNGGLSYVIGNLLQQGPNGDNSTMLAYGAEGLSNANRALYVVNNTFVNDRGSGTFIAIAGGATATVQNNLFVGNGTTIGGTATAVDNLQTNTPNFVDRAAHDYRPTAATPGRDGGTAPGSGGSFSLSPVYQYIHPINRQARPSDGAIDIGAYEYVDP